ncbi:MAG: isoprenyl transferase [Bdellovibrionales bacterium]|nr:isoprenyl transferase [Bdellovibrionales bacterium]
MSENPKPLTHVGIIMDGNGRWAKNRNLERSQGHQAGVKKAIEIVKHASHRKIQFLTLYAFSSENWSRPETEVSTLMKLLQEFLFSELPTFIEHQVRLVTIGDTQKLPLFARGALHHVIEKTKNHTGLTLVLALSYGGRDEIKRALGKLLEQAQKGDVNSKTLTEEHITNALDTSFCPDPELVIRTSGEFRTSNFLLWQCAYSEYAVTETLWPDFTPQEFDQAIDSFHKRDRRFGGV